MADPPWFYRREDDGIAIVERLKQTPCPHCHTVGTLIRHGVLTGFDDSTPPRPAIRARRIFCSNRQRRHGCGRTFSIWIADRIRRLSLTTRTLWTFLQRAVVGSIAAAVRDTDCPRSDRPLQRLWTRFDRGQSAIRTAQSRSAAGDPGRTLPSARRRPGSRSSPGRLSPRRLSHRRLPTGAAHLRHLTRPEPRSATTPS